MGRRSRTDLAQESQMAGQLWTGLGSERVVACRLRQERRRSCGLTILRQAGRHHARALCQVCIVSDSYVLGVPESLAVSPAAS
jgi:hypothetical protein